MNRACTRCGIEKPRTREFFPGHAGTKDGLGSYCLACKLEIKRAWCRANPERVRNASRRRRERISPAELLYFRTYTRLNNSVGVRAAGLTVADILGCSCAEFAAHVEARFLPEMGWHNADAWHVDHVRPLSAFDLTNPDELRAAFHFTNTQPLWSGDNLKKGARMAA